MASFMSMFQAPPMPSKLQVRRAVRLSWFALAVGLIGLIILGEHGSDGVMAAGIFIFGLCYGACMLLIPTGIQRLIGNTDATGLDEFQLRVRLKAQSDTYRWFTLFVVEVIGALALAARLHLYESSTSSTSFLAVFFFIVVAGLTFPVLAAAKNLGDWNDSASEGVDA
jgi:preprotein translocase subunit SecG